ncbi:MAG: Holliday junction branch migration protein RuvA [Ruminococcaceae bacterium]|nr:Holliday junction branch migration protein RuvA [Oscillospiraceae bacterium]
MYYYIKGEVVLKESGFVVVDNSGVGYKIYTSGYTLANLTEKTATLFTYLHVREDVFDLYGFSTQEELSMFIHLLSVSGVGPKAALSILSVVSPGGLAAAIITNDAKTLTKASGVGAKMAQRVILELKDKLKNSQIIPEELSSFDADSAESSGKEAVSALMVLGYSQNDAKRAVASVDQSLSTEEIITLALKKMMK